MNIANEVRTECVPTDDSCIPNFSGPMRSTIFLRVSVIFADVIQKVCPELNKWHVLTVVFSHVFGYVHRRMIMRAQINTGHRSDPDFELIIISFLTPFFCDRNRMATQCDLTDNSGF